MKTKQLKTVQRFALMDRRHPIMDDEDAIREERDRLKREFYELLNHTYRVGWSRQAARRAVERL